jgi:NADH dehydrogenase FAD-containing subunit
VEKQGGTFTLGKAVRVDPEEKIVFLESGETVPYDVLSFNIGSYVPTSNVKGDDRDIFLVKPIERLMEAQARILELVSQKKIFISIIGGGPSGAEIAGNIWRLARDSGKDMPVIRIFAGKKLMENFPDSVRIAIEGSLTKRGIEILVPGYVREVTNGQVVLESGQRYESDIIFMALGVKPSPIFSDSGLPAGPDGGLLVNEYLQCSEYPELFGGGDCIYFKNRPLDKVGVYAVRQNPVLLANLMAALEGTALQPFDPGGDYLLIFNMGDGTGVVRKKWLQFGGRLGFIIKDYIDRKFMKKFQALE